ncbi:MAG: OsmC family protein [Roseivirga sp.]|nr:OsmC family protein [Roseivirga sp.]
MKRNSIVLERQKPLMASYIVNPEKAWVTDMATVEGQHLSDPFHTKVMVNEELQYPFPIGVHRAVGGLHDAPNPGDILCTAMAACFESTLRLVANRLGIVLKYTSVKATAEVDVRGTLMIDKTVPVAFQKMGLQVEISTDSPNKGLVEVLLKATEHSCIILQTLKAALSVTIQHQIVSEPQLVDQV